MNTNPLKAVRSKEVNYLRQTLVLQSLPTRVIRIKFVSPNSVDEMVESTDKQSSPTPLEPGDVLEGHEKHLRPACVYSARGCVKAANLYHNAASEVLRCWCVPETRTSRRRVNRTRRHVQQWKGGVGYLPRVKHIIGVTDNGPRKSSGDLNAVTTDGKDPG